MKSTKMIAVVVLVLLTLGSLWLLPSMAGQGKGKGSSLVVRVEALEEQVTDLAARVEELEGGSCTCDTINLPPLSEFPSNASEGDLCLIAGEGWDGYPTSELYCYRVGEWRMLAADLGSEPPIRPPPAVP